MKHHAILLLVVPEYMVLNPEVMALIRIDFLLLFYATVLHFYMDQILMAFRILFGQVSS
jgi:hypothetical protein